MGKAAAARLFVQLQWALLGGFAVVLAVTGPDQDSTGALIAAVALLITGAAIGLAALNAHRKVNGSAFVNASPQPTSNSKLVTSGIYSKIRHPIYLANSLILTAVAIFNSHWIGVVFAAILVAFYAIKLRFEESLLLQNYPEYANYKESTGALLPLLFRKQR